MHLNSTGFFFSSVLGFTISLHYKTCPLDGTGLYTLACAAWWLGGLHMATLQEGLVPSWNLSV